MAIGVLSGKTSIVSFGKTVDIESIFLTNILLYRLKVPKSWQIIRGGLSAVYK